MIWFCLVLYYQEFYYIDGVELHLVNGTVIKTAAELHEDQYSYTWVEDGLTIAIEKFRVKSIRHFSMRVKGRIPHKTYKTAAQRRISGKPITYRWEGATYLKCRHVDRRGRAAEGGVALNVVKELRIAGRDETGLMLLTTFSKITAKTRIIFRFYDMKGKIIHEAFADMDRVSGSRKKRQRKNAGTYSFTTPSLDPESLGLIEVTSTKKE